MGKTIKRYVRAAIVIAILVLIVAIAIGVWSYVENDDEPGASEAVAGGQTSAIYARPSSSPGITWPPHPPILMGLTEDAARTYIDDAGFAAVIDAVEAGDASRLVALAQRATHYCSSLRGMIPAGCADYTSYVPSVRETGGTNFRHRLLDEMRVRLSSVLSLKPAKLEFASRLTTPQEGTGDQYWLLFRVPGEVMLADNSAANALGLILEPGRPDPIERFVFFDQKMDALYWLVRDGLTSHHTEIWSSY